MQVLWTPALHYIPCVRFYFLIHHVVHLPLIILPFIFPSVPFQIRQCGLSTIILLSFLKYSLIIFLLSFPWPYHFIPQLTCYILHFPRSSLFKGFQIICFRILCHYFLLFPSFSCGSPLRIDCTRRTNCTEEVVVHHKVGMRIAQCWKCTQRHGFRYFLRNDDICK